MAWMLDNWAPHTWENFQDTVESVIHTDHFPAKIPPWQYVDASNRTGTGRDTSRPTKPCARALC